MIALCDQRSFYASCELIFRPDLRGQPVAVLSNNDGCVVALNEQAKACGIQKFAPFFKQAKLARQCNVAIFSSNYALYGEVSRRIMAILAAQAPHIEVYSIDEAFLNLDGLTGGQLEPLSQDLRQRIWQQQRIPMGVSVGATKTLAKLGQFAAKKITKLNGVCILETPQQISWVANRTPTTEIWGVGSRLALHLASQGITNAGQLMRMPLGLVKKTGHLPLVRTVKELNGERCIPFESTQPHKQTIVCSRSFGQKVTHIEVLLQAVSEFAVRAAEKLRKQNSLCRTINVFISTGAHAQGRHIANDNFCFAAPTADARTITHHAKRILNTLYLSGYNYAKAGVTLAGITPTKLSQQDFWHGDTQQSTAAMKVLDAINTKYGRNTVKLAAQGFTQQHAMRQTQLSPRYLTCWHDIPRVQS